MNLAQLQQKVTAGYEQAANNVLTLLKQVGRNSPMGDELVRLDRHLEYEIGQSDRFIGMLREGIVPEGFMLGHPKGDDLVRALIRPAHDNPNRWSENAKYDQALATQTAALLNNMSEKRNRLDQIYNKLRSQQPPVYRRYVDMQTRKTVSGDLSGLMQTLMNQINVFQSMYGSLANNDTPSARYLAQASFIADGLLKKAKQIQLSTQRRQWLPQTTRDLANDLFSLHLRLNQAHMKPGASDTIPQASGLAKQIGQRLGQMAQMMQQQADRP